MGPDERSDTRLPFVSWDDDSAVFLLAGLQLLQVSPHLVGNHALV